MKKLFTRLMRAVAGSGSVLVSVEETAFLADADLSTICRPRVSVPVSSESSSL